MSYEIQNEEIQTLLIGVTSYLKKELPKGWGSALFVFQYNGEAMFYASSADRVDMMKALREFLERESKSHGFGKTTSLPKGP